MDQLNPKDQPKRKRVLRATDVIPPFDKVESAPAEGVRIPTYDLAENILAEQRRVAGRRRRGPGEAPVPKTEAAPQTPATSCSLRPPASTFPEPVSPDLLDLQQIVSQIVARDIERLCKKPNRPPSAASA